MQKHIAVRPGIVPICDFCGTPNVVYSYPALDCVVYRTEEIQGNSLGAWASCPECARLIEAKDKEGLLQRSLASYLESFNCPIPAEYIDRIKTALKAVHKAFWLCKHGERKEENA